MGALRRQSYAWHVNDASRAMRKWKEHVRRRREGERLLFELSRISAVSTSSPLTPRSARAHTAGSWTMTPLGFGSGLASAVRGPGTESEERGSAGLYNRSPLSPALNSARRLWEDRTD